MRLFDPLSSSVDMYTRIVRAGSSIRRLIELEEIRCSIEERKNPLALDSVETLACKDISFGYGSKHSVLANANLRIGRGTSVALVGPSGGGKSTLTKLLVRLYDPQEGSIYLNGIDIRDLRLSDIRRYVTLVPQQPALFCGSIRQNALIGSANATDDELERCAELAGFRPVLQKFPDRWEQRLGPAGAGLSDGEKQRLGILRGLLRHTPVLILDEATSAIDPMTEHKVLQNLKPEMAEKLMLLITHRPLTASWADALCILSGGVLLAADSNELTQSSPKDSAMVQDGGSNGYANLGMRRVPTT
jgi:ABC-type multidrug transport system fused ATPase/permease subunit